MHNVRNIGSILQAFALQYKIESLGHSVELIDYNFSPIREANRPVLKNFIKNIIILILNAIWGFPNIKFQNKLRQFKKKYFNLSQYSFDRTSILNSPPQYDIYCTGSDQVWNPRFIEDDTTFMLDFVKNFAPKISYAASFATDDIPERYVKQYKSCLSQYKDITVRENEGSVIIKKLLDKNCQVVCDPTLLLTPTEWEKIANDSKLVIREKYILVYLLGYMFEPRPYFYEIVQTVQKSLNIKVYFINGWIHDMKQPDAKVLFGVGPTEFVSLFKNATFVITDSFHGTAFATIFNIPMLGVVKNLEIGDGRLKTLLKQVDNSDAIVQYDKPLAFDSTNLSKYTARQELLIKFREKSISCLKNMIN